MLQSHHAGHTPTTLDGGGGSPDDAPLDEVDARVGVVILGHAHTASQLLAAARAIMPAGLEGVMTVDAGTGETPVLQATLCTTIARADQGRGVVMIVDLFGASPCACGLRERAGHEVVVLSGLNLAMLLKLATIDRARVSPSELARACADSGTRSVRVVGGEEPTQRARDDEAEVEKERANELCRDAEREPAQESS